jgi:2-haloalkanoic acid dehalogenase type II
MTIRLITFDLDNTLWDVEPVVARAENLMRDWIKTEHPAFVASFDLREFSRIRHDVVRERAEIAHDLTALRIEVLRRAFVEGGYSSSDALAAANAAFDVYFDARNAVEFFPGVLEALTALHMDFDLHALSNGNADIQRVGLGHLFKQHFSAAGVGAAKPDPRMFQAALAASGLMPSQVLHIGDHPEQDIAAAAAVGMHTLWINFGDQVWPDVSPADAEITAFDQLLPAVYRLAKQ